MQTERIIELQNKIFLNLLICHAYILKYYESQNRNLNNWIFLSIDFN